MRSVVEIEGETATPEDLHRLAVQNYGHFTSMQVRQGRVLGFGWHLDLVSGLVRSSRGSRQPIGSIDDIIFTGDPVLHRALDDAWNTVLAEEV